MPPAPPITSKTATALSINPSSVLLTGEQQLLFTLSQVEELIDNKMKEHRGAAIAPLRERPSHLFIVALMGVRIPNYMVARPIPKYNGGVDLIIHVNRHEASFLGKADSDNHLALIFPSTLLGSTSSWFFGLHARSIGSWSELKRKFVEHYKGEHQLLKSVVDLDVDNQEKSYPTSTCVSTKTS